MKLKFPQAKAPCFIDWCTYDAAKYAIENWHYSKRMPKSKLVKIGVWEDEKFVGVVIFGVGATSELLSPYGLKSIDGCELVRIALKSGHKTPVTRIVKICLKMLKKQNPGLRLVVSFADPGEGHHGGIYQGGGWIYTGKSIDCKFPVINGRVAHPRTLSLLVKAGKVKRGQVKYVIKSGKHRYLMPLDDKMKIQIERLKRPYPKRALSKDSVASAFHAEEGCAIQTNALKLS